MPFITDNAYDAALNYIKTNCTKVYLCHTSEPTTYTEATSTYACGNVTVASTDFTIAAGDTSGRKLTFDGKTGGSGTASQTGIYFAFTNGSDELLAVTPCTSLEVTNGGTVNFNTYDITEFQDPVTE